MRYLMTIAAVFCTILLQARNLDYIDADGVTETGGPGKARMLPRTGSDGRLSTTLLPPVADWASQPIPGFRYVSQGAAAGGNGSPQYPFRTIAEAFAASPSGTAVMLAPGNYSETVPLAGKSLTVFGFGQATSIDSLTVAVGGVSELRFVGCGVGVLQLDGADVDVRLSGTVVGAVHGNAGVRLVRTDMGSYVRSWTTTGEHTERYDGYDLVTNAVVLVGPGATLVMGRDRPVVTVGGMQEQVSYVSELTESTNRIYASISDITATNAVLAARLTLEENVRSNEIVRVEEALALTSGVVRAEIDRVDEAAQAQAGVLLQTISKVAVSFTNLTGKVQEDMEYMSNRVDDVEREYKQADGVISNELMAAMLQEVSDLRAEVPDLTSPLIEAAIEPVSKSLDDLAELVDEHHENFLESVEALNDQISAISTTLTGVLGDLIDLTTRLEDLEDRVNKYHGTPPTP